MLMQDAIRGISMSQGKREERAVLCLMYLAMLSEQNVYSQNAYSLTVSISLFLNRITWRITFLFPGA